MLKKLNKKKSIKKKRDKDPRPFTLVRMHRDIKKENWKNLPPYAADFPLVYLGEIKNMPGHGIFLGHYSGRLYSGFHISDFEEIPEDEA